MKVYADLRWPRRTGIGEVQAALLERCPPALEVVDLQIMGRIGSVASPLRITQSLNRKQARAGVFWSPGYMPPLKTSLPAVVTVHDLAHRHFYTSLHRTYYDWLLKGLFLKCSAVVCVSDFTRREFLEWSGMSADRVFMVHNGVSQKFFEDGGVAEMSYPYLFYPGNRRRYKNLDRLFEAFANSRLPDEGIHFVLTGDPDDRLGRLCRRLGISEMIHFIGAVGDAGLVQLYRGAVLVPFVSLYEGFGLPILEAMAVGTPVVTSNVGAMPETAGGAALLVDPLSIESIRTALERLTFETSLRVELVNKGKIRAASFDWGSSSQITWKIIEDAA